MSKSTPKIEIVTLTSANTEFSWRSRNKCTQITFQSRNSVPIRFAYVTGKVAGSTDPYFTLKSGCAKTLEDIHSDFTIFFASPVANQTIEIESST